MKRTKKILKEMNMRNKFEVMIKNYLLTYGNTDDMYSHMEDIVNYGCQSGSVGFVIYTKDNKRLFKRYSLEILEIVQDYQNEIGELPHNADLTNVDWLIWFAIEYTVNRFLHEVEDIIYCSTH